MRVENLTGRVRVDRLREGIPVILTEGAKDFSGIEGITALNPFA